MLKVCYIITKLELGGAQKFTLYTAENINKEHFEVSLICGINGILDEEAKKNIRTLFLPDLVREISPVKDLKALFKIWKILRKEKPDIVHTHSSKAGILGRIAAKLAGIKTIIHTIHGYGFNETQSKPVKYFYIFLEKFCSLLSDKLIVENPQDIQKGLKYKIAGEQKYTIVVSGIDTEYYKTYKLPQDFKTSLVKDTNSKIIFTIGPFKPQKNLTDFIKAASLVSKQIDNAFFLIAGDGELRSELELLIKTLNMEDKVILLGWRRDIVKLLHLCDIFVMTSLWEGLPLSIIEAMCCAKPVIANAIDGVKGIIQNGHTGFLTEPYDYKTTAEKIIYLLNNPNILKEFAQTAKNSITINYDINYCVKQQEDLYKQLTGAK